GAETGPGRRGGPARNGNDALAPRRARRHEPDELLLDGEKKANADPEDDRPQYRHGRHAGRAQAVTSDSELGVRADPEHREPRRHQERPSRQQARSPAREFQWRSIRAAAILATCSDG